MSRKPTGALVLLTIVTLLWSSSYVIIKVGLRTIPPLSFAAYRYSLAALFLLLYVFLSRETRRLSNILVSRPGVSILLGATGIALMPGLQFLGLFYTTVVDSAIILSLNPVHITLLSFVFLREDMNLRKGLGIAVAVSGALLVTGLGAQTSLDLSRLWGDVLILLSGVSWAVYVVLSKRLLGGVASLDLTAVSMSTGSVLLLMFSLLVEGWVVSSLGVNESLIILFLALFNTSVAFALWNEGLKRIEASKAGVFQNTMLPWTIALSTVFLGEILTPINVVGGAMVLLGVVLAQTA